MLSYKQDVSIPKENLNIVHYYIYDTDTDRYGMISEIHLYPMLDGMSIMYYAYFDSVNNHEIIFFEDFIKGRIKFVLLTDSIYKNIREKEICAIKNFLKESYTDNSIIWISDRERKDKLNAQDYREKKKIGEKLIWAEDSTLDFIFDSYSAQKIICLYADEVISEMQMLYELINIIAAQMRTEKDIKLNIGAKELRKAIEENKDFFENIYNKNKENDS